jgi:CheY-like chemotaxis protein
MPDMNGAELIERLRQEEELATVPVLIYTAYSPEDIAPALEAGAIEAFYKPFDLDKLISYVTQFAEQLPDA